MNLDDLSGYIIDRLYSGLTGGTAEMPLPKNVRINWIQPGIPFDKSAFDWAIAGPYAGPTPLTLDYFKELVDTIQGKDDTMGRDEVIEEAKRMYSQQLLGSWEQWSNLVDFIPLEAPLPENNGVETKGEQGKYKHISVVYGQAGQKLSQVYKDTLEKCDVANDPLTDKEKDIIKRMRGLLMTQVEKEDFFTGETVIEFQPSKIMQAYKAKRRDYENAVTEYAEKLAQANNGTAADLITWSRSGGIYKRRVTEAMRDWIASGYKADVERAQATINHILGKKMQQWKDNLLQDVINTENNLQGTFGNSFFPAGLLPGGFARSEGWTKFSEKEFHKKIKSSSKTREIAARTGLNLGLFSVGGGGGYKSERNTNSKKIERFELSFEYTQVEITRPAFNPNFFLSRGWKPDATFIRDYQEQHSDGKETPTGAMIGYPTKALFVRNLKIVSTELARFMETKKEDIKAGLSFGYGPFSIGGKYAQSSKNSEYNLDINGATITINGIQLVGFISSLFPKTANPSPEIKNWI